MVDVLAYKIAHRYVMRNLTATIGDPKEFLSDFERAVDAATIPPALLEHAKKTLAERIAGEANGTAPSMKEPAVRKELFDAQDTAARAFVKIKNSHLVAQSGHKLFLSILQTLTLPPPLRKKVEMASRAYLKTTKPRFKSKYGPARYLEQIEVYEKYLATLHAHLGVAKESIAKGKAHVEEGEGATKIKAGSFTLINTGGFSEKQMNEVADVMQKAASYAQSSGLGEVCYGDVQVTNTIHKSNVLAFYLVANDEMFIRANVKAETDTIRTVLHELGHRYEHKFLKNKHAPAMLYQTLEGQERKRSDKEIKKPEPGDTLKAKGKTYIVLNTVPATKGFKVNLTVEGDPKAKASVPLDAFWELKGETARNFDEDPEYIGFVTDYAKRGGPSENFAEMFAFYCMGRLPVKQSVPFEETIFGTKTANAHMARRIVTRYGV